MGSSEQTEGKQKINKSPLKHVARVVTLGALATVSSLSGAESSSSKIIVDPAYAVDMQQATEVPTVSPPPKAEYIPRRPLDTFSHAATEYITSHVLEVENASKKYPGGILQEPRYGGTNLNLFFSTAQGAQVKEVFPNSDSVSSNDQLKYATDIGLYLAWNSMNEQKSALQQNLVPSNPKNSDEIVQMSQRFAKRMQGEDFTFQIEAFNTEHGRVEKTVVDPRKQIVFAYSDTPDGQRGVSFNVIDGILFIGLKNYKLNEVGFGYSQGLAALSDKEIQTRMVESSDGVVQMTPADESKMQFSTDLISLVKGRALDAR